MVEEGTFCENDDVKKKVGDNASASITEDFTNKYIQETEGWIMGEVKKEDLVDNHADLPNAVKQLLKSICSNVSAIYAIQYNFSNWSVRADAENKIRVLWGLAKKQLKTLKGISIK